MYDFSSACVLACISENPNSVIREWGRGRWPVMWVKTGNEFCLIILFCHCCYIATCVANNTVLFGGVGVRNSPKICRNLWKVGGIRGYSNCGIAPAGYWLGETLRIADSPNACIHQHETHAELPRNSKSLSSCTSAPLCGLWNLHGLKYKWIRISEVMFRAAGFTCFNLCFFLCQYGQGRNKPPQVRTSLHPCESFVKHSSHGNARF